MFASILKLLILIFAIQLIVQNGNCSPFKNSAGSSKSNADQYKKIDPNNKFENIVVQHIVGTTKEAFKDKSGPECSRNCKAFKKEVGGVTHYHVNFETKGERRDKKYLVKAKVEDGMVEFYRMDAKSKKKM